MNLVDWNESPTEVYFGSTVSEIFAAEECFDFLYSCQAIWAHDLFSEVTASACSHGPVLDSVTCCSLVFGHFQQDCLCDFISDFNFWKSQMVFIWSWISVCCVSRDDGTDLISICGCFICVFANFDFCAETRFPGVFCEFFEFFVSDLFL